MYAPLNGDCPQKAERNMHSFLPYKYFRLSVFFLVRSFLSSHHCTCWINIFTLPLSFIHWKLSRHITDELCRKRRHFKWPPPQKKTKMNSKKVWMPCSWSVVPFPNSCDSWYFKWHPTLHTKSIIHSPKIKWCCDYLYCSKMTICILMQTD